MNNETNNVGKFTKKGRPMVTDETGKVVPLKYDWSKANLLWQNCTNKEVAQKLSVVVNGVTYHPSPVAVFLKRKAMEEAGKKVTCKKAKWTRAKSIKEASEAKKAKAA